MEKYQAGIDVGSTTVKLVIVNEKKEIVFAKYQRHYSDIRNAVLKIFKDAEAILPNEAEVAVMVTGSAGIGLAEVYDFAFVQEVIACTEAVEQFIPEADVVIELGGEDAKITFLKDSFEQRMNGTCAGGTGAFIDQMASLLNTDASGINELAKEATTLYPIASRCGVFAKTDVQPLMNQGAKKEDIAASILQAVVNQSIASLAAGRKITGKVAFLGGPLAFLSQLRQAFITTLELAPADVIFPENALLYVALGAAIYPKNQKYLAKEELYQHLKGRKLVTQEQLSLPPLFASQEALTAFKTRHEAAKIPLLTLDNYHGPLFVGIDAGSTTTKVAAIDDQGNIRFEYYGSNQGEPLEAVLAVLLDLQKQIAESAGVCFIARVTVTGYGEDLIKHAFHLDRGIVETMAHYRAAKHFLPEVDYILDIGGQDMKAIQLKDGHIASIQLNEACSSGCGSFIETFAEGLTYNVKDFASVACEGQHPADLGSKCTVFMNSKVKQAQKEGHEVADIAAGLAYSVVKNALYKVIKVRKAEELGENIVVQGGTFYNDSVLRALELELGRNVVRPNIAGLMGAYGCALISLEDWQELSAETVSTLLDAESLANFAVQKKFGRCRLCANLCALTFTYFPDGQRFVSGNRCEKGAGVKLEEQQEKINLVDYRYQKLFQYPALSKEAAWRGVLGMPRALNIYDSYPLWHTVFTELGFRVELSPRSNKEVYERGLCSLASDTICYPAKITHGHIQYLIDQGISTIFFPSVVYEKPEFKGANNHLNCYVAMGYPKVIQHNLDEIISGQVTYHAPTLNLGNPALVVADLLADFAEFQISEAEMQRAVKKGFAALDAFRQDLRLQGELALERIVATGERGIVLAGRPYHIDPEINHGISKLVLSEGFHVLTEDSIAHLGDVNNLRVTNQWEYASRLFAAAKVTGRFKNLDFVQLNSFGCGLDSVTTDQLNEILAPFDKVCTTLKIDEGANLGAIKIRLRSLKVSLEEREKNKIKS